MHPLFTECLLWLGIVLDTGDLMVTQIDMVPDLMELKAKAQLVMTKHNSQLTS